VDIWSTGCILSEMICSTKTYKVETRKRILFPGKYCDPISPPPKGKEREGEKYHQLRMIMDILGKQDKYDLSFISTRDSYDYAK